MAAAFRSRVALLGAAALGWAACAAPQQGPVAVASEEPPAVGSERQVVVAGPEEVPGAEPAPVDAPPASNDDAARADAGDSAPGSSAGSRRWAVVAGEDGDRCVELKESASEPEDEWRADARLGDLHLLLRARQRDGVISLYRFQLSTSSRYRGGYAALCNGTAEGATNLSLFADSASCEAALPQTPSPRCLADGIARFAEIREEARVAAEQRRREFLASDPLLARMRRGASVWTVEDAGCTRWSLAPTEGDPTRGGVSRTRKLPDGVVETYGYGYQYRPDVMVLLGGGGSRQYPDGTREGWGMGCMSEQRVVHRAGASDVGATRWHYSLRACQREARRRAARAKEPDSEPVTIARLGC